MPYTISDWFRDHAEVQIRVPGPRGEFLHYWVPFSVFDEGARGPEWMEKRTWPGREPEDFAYGMDYPDEQEEEGGK